MSTLRVDIVKENISQPNRVSPGLPDWLLTGQSLFESVPKEASAPSVLGPSYTVILLDCFQDRDLVGKYLGALTEVI